MDFQTQLQGSFECNDKTVYKCSLAFAFLISSFLTHVFEDVNIWIAIVYYNIIHL